MFQVQPVVRCFKYSQLSTLSNITSTLTFNSKCWPLGRLSNTCKTVLVQVCWHCLGHTYGCCTFPFAKRCWSHARMKHLKSIKKNIGWRWFEFMNTLKIIDYQKMLVTLHRPAWPTWWSVHCHCHDNLYHHHNQSFLQCYIIIIHKKNYYGTC